MKRKRGCEACRSRHRKCVFPTGADTCYGCQETSRPCKGTSRFIFVSTPPSTEAECTRPQLAAAAIDSAFSPGIISTSPDAISPSSQVSLGARSPLGMTRREADLFSLYIRRLAPMMDSCDEDRHFTLMVPSLALHQPMLLHSILALASRYDALHHDSTPGLDATLHNSRCIELLIRELAQPSEMYGAGLLAAVVMSRSYEECDFEADLNHHHLSGTKNLLVHESISRLASGGGLAEAAAWVHLRQAIYACLVRRHPMDNLDFFDRILQDEYKVVSPTNQMVYLLAKTLRLYFTSSEDRRSSGVERWQELHEEASAWWATKPASFEPIYSLGQGETQHHFPVTIMALATSVMGLQYYYACSIMFSLRDYEMITPRSGLETARTRKKLERSIASALFDLMGLAISNDHVEDAFLLPTHILSLCGFCIQSRSQRELTLAFLAKVKEKIHWITDSLVTSLSEYWTEVDGVDG